jgi:hypothetical protein
MGVWMALCSAQGVRYKTHYLPSSLSLLLIFFSIIIPKNHPPANYGVLSSVSPHALRSSPKSSTERHMSCRLSRVHQNHRISNLCVCVLRNSLMHDRWSVVDGENKNRKSRTSGIGHHKPESNVADSEDTLEELMWPSAYNKITK